MIRLLPFLLTALVSGCVFVPYTPDAEVVHQTGQPVDYGSILLSGGPRRFLGDIGESIVAAEPRVSILPALEFRDMVFPDGNWTLAALLADASRERVVATDTDFLVVLGQLSYAEDDSDNKMFFAYGFYGYMDIDTHADLNVLLVDLGANRVAEVMRVESDAAIRGVGAFYGLFFLPRTEHGVKKALAQQLAQSLALAKPTGPIRIAILAAESPDGVENPLAPGVVAGSPPAAHLAEKF